MPSLSFSSPSSLSLRTGFIRNSSKAMCHSNKKLYVNPHSRKITTAIKAKGTFNICNIFAQFSKLSFVRTQQCSYCAKNSELALLSDSNGCINEEEVIQGSKEWLDMRKGILTASTFSSALGFWSGRRVRLWEEKVFDRDNFKPNHAMQWGTNNEEFAVERYSKITGHALKNYGIKIDEQRKWLGASPDRVISGSSSELAGKLGGILEVKCPFNKGKPLDALPWESVPFYYMPQIQGLMEIFNTDWLHLYCWTPNASNIIKVSRDSAYWELIHERLKDFWWNNVVPARSALLMHGKTCVEVHKPSPTDAQTEDIVAESKLLAEKGILICKEVNGEITFVSDS